MQNIDRIWYDCWCSKLNISVFITESYSAGPKNIKLNSTHHFIMKIWKKMRVSTNFISSLIRYWF